MEDTVEKSCWGVAVKAALGFAAIILLIWLGSGDSATVVAAAR
ncbi:hypothetical protein [Limoniibacter endophyticus]|nr:hypothetical protein [Limoniibacter endophyticus]